MIVGELFRQSPEEGNRKTPRATLRIGTVCGHKVGLRGRVRIRTGGHLCDWVLGVYFSGYRMPESFKAFCRIVSLTAAKTKRIFEVSVAWVRLKGKGGK